MDDLRKHAADSLQRLILDFEMDIDDVAAQWAGAWPSIDADTLGEIWVEVMSNMPELN